MAYLYLKTPWVLICFIYVENHCSNITMVHVVQSLSCVQLFVTSWIAARQASLFFIISRSLLKLMSVSWWCHPTLSSSDTSFSSCPQSFPTSGYFPVSQLFPSGVQSIEASASASVLPMNISSRIDWFDLAVQEALKSLLQHHNSKTSILWHSAFFMVQLSHSYMTTGKTIALTLQSFVSQVMSLLFNMLSKFVFFPLEPLIQSPDPVGTPCSHRPIFTVAVLVQDCISFYFIGYLIDVQSMSSTMHPLSSSHSNNILGSSMHACSVV